MNRHLIGFFSKPLQAIVASAAAAALLFAAVAAALPKNVKVSSAFTITQQARQETADYSYDGYYALRASELVADTMISWLATPSFIKEVYADAKIPMSDAEIAALAERAFRGKKFSSQNVVISFSVPDEATASKLWAHLALTIKDRVSSLVLSPDQQTLFLAAASAPVITQGGIPPSRAALAGGFVGAFIGLACVYASQKKNP